MKDTLIAIITIEPVSKSEDTGASTGGIFSKAPSKSYSEGWDRIFGKKEAELSPETKRSLN